MPFPDAEHATIPSDKLIHYLLDLSHPVGGAKAAWFASLGYTSDNPTALEEDLLRIARTCDDFVSKPSSYGVKYEASGIIGRAGYRPARVVTVWIVEENSMPRLITAYPG